MRRSARGRLARLARLEAALRPDGRCQVCGVRPHPIRWIEIRSCDSDGRWPLAPPPEPPCPACGRFRIIPILEEIRPKALPWPDRGAAEEETHDDAT